MIQMKTCTRCKQEKSLDAFAKRRSSPDGLQYACKACARKWQQEHPEAMRDTWNRYRRRTYLEKTYGITEAQYEEMLDRQKGVCESCGRPGDDPRPNRRPLHVDHDHSCCPGKESCGKCVRALLCKKCNLLLGVVQDDPSHLAKAIVYLSGQQYEKDGEETVLLASGGGRHFVYANLKLDQARELHENLGNFLESTLA